MRLIDADEVLNALEKVFHEYSLPWLPDDENGGSAYAVPNAIKNIPTVYDMDKVISQLERLRCKHSSIDNTFQRGAKNGANWTLNKAIEIVKRGGKDGE